MGVLSKKQSDSNEDPIAVFLTSSETVGFDDISICSRALDVLLRCFGDRSCGIWKTDDERLLKISERGMAEAFVASLGSNGALSQLMTVDKPLFHPVDESFIPDSDHKVEGFFAVPIAIAAKTWGFLFLSGKKKEFVEPASARRLTTYAAFLGTVLRQGQDREDAEVQQRRLRAEVGATTRELSETNRKLIERVKELKGLYEELQKKVEELTKANRAKDEFLSIVSHELRTPLTSLTGFLSVLLEEEAGPVNEQQRKFLNITKQSANRLNLIISDLLDISRIEAGRLNMEMVSCGLEEIVARSVEGLRGVAETKSLTIHYERPSRPMPTVLGDSSRLQQVVDNLISNSIKFTERGGSITVSVSRHEEFIKVAVQDTGRGMTEEEQRFVFDMFYQADASTRRAAGGAGLGLAIAKGIVSMHGGRISVESEKGRGSTFSFFVPSYRAEKAA